MYEIASDAEAAQILLGDLAADFPDRVFRMKTLLSLDADFGGSGVMLPGGEASYRAYIEARSSFVAGNFVSTILLSQGLLENLLGGQLIVDDVSREVQGKVARTSRAFGDRPQFKQLIDHAIEAGILTNGDVRDIERLVNMRNPLIHFRDVNDPQNLTRRAMQAGKHADQIMFEDARFAIGTIIGVVGKSQFAIDRSKEV